MTTSEPRSAVRHAHGPECFEDLVVLREGQREGRRRRLQAELVSLDRLVRVPALDFRRLECAIRERFEDWRGLMEREVDHARRILNATLVGRRVFTPHEEGATRYYEVVGRWSIGRALAGVIQAKGMVTLAGFEPAISTVRRGGRAQAHRRNAPRDRL